jgi:hypothetical protein
LTKKILVGLVGGLLVIGIGVLVNSLALQDTTDVKAENERLKQEVMYLKLEVTKNKPEATGTLDEKDPCVKESVAYIIQRIRPQLDVSIVSQIDRAIMKYSKMYRIPPEFIVYLMKRESNFQPLAKSPVGAIGLMQVFPKWHRDKMQEMGINYEAVYHIDNNVRLGCWILREYYDATGSIEKALTRYVGGKHEKYVKDILVGFANEMIPKEK